MLQTTDFYPTREANKENRFSRKEPVVHASPAQRAEGPLSEKELKQYERDGFLSLEGYFSPDAVAPFFDELHQIEKDPEMCRKDQVIMDPNQHKVRSVFDMHSISSAFDRMTRHPHLLAMVQQLLGSDVYIHQSRINDKSGFCGNGFEWHSDFETWHSEDGMPSMRAVSASIMLTDNNAFNGPLMLIPGSHQSFVPCPGETPEGNWTQSLQKQTVGVPPREAVADLANAGGIEQPLAQPVRCCCSNATLCMRPTPICRPGLGRTFSLCTTALRTVLKSLFAINHPGRVSLRQGVTRSRLKDFGAEGLGHNPDTNC